MLEMLEKGTSREDLKKMRREKLFPIEEEIKRVEEVIKSEAKFGREDLF
jgi:hypothetical protein